MADLIQSQEPWLVTEIYKIKVEHFLEDKNGNRVSLDRPFYVQQSFFKSELNAHEPSGFYLLKEALNRMCEDILERARME